MNTHIRFRISQSVYGSEKNKQYLGHEISSRRCCRCFRRLDLPVRARRRNIFTVTPPLERLDLIISEDPIEEVGRIIGCDKIPDTPLPPLSRSPSVNKNFYAAERVREVAKQDSQGYSEVFLRPSSPTRASASSPTKSTACGRICAPISSTN